MKAIFSIPQNPPPEINPSFSDQFRQFVSFCLRKKPEERWTACQLNNHPFVKRRDEERGVDELRNLAHNQIIKERGGELQSDVSNASSVKGGKLTVSSDDSGWDFTVKRSIAGSSIHGTISSNDDLSSPLLSEEQVSF